MFLLCRKYSKLVTMHREKAYTTGREIGLDEFPDKLRLQVARLTSEFLAPYDTLLFIRGICEATKVHKKLLPNKEINALDLGSNTGIPDIIALLEGRIQQALAIEVSSSAVQIGKRISELLQLHHQITYHCQSMSDDTCFALADTFGPTLVASNPPYLPSTNQSTREVIGGTDGTLFFPIIFRYADSVQAPVVTTNLCSLTNLQAVFLEVDKRGYAIQNILLLKRPFGHYTTQLAAEGVFNNREFELFYYTDPEGVQHQLLINMILVKKEFATSLQTIDTRKFFENMVIFSQTGKWGA